MQQDHAKLDEMTEDEWSLVIRKVRPDIDEKQFHNAWLEFCELKLKRGMQ